MLHQPKSHKYISFLIVLFIVLSIATPALADYLGPKRTVTQTVSVCKIVLYECRQTDDNRWKDHMVDDWSCANESKPWQAYPGSGTCHVGDQGRKHWERDERLETVTATYPPATISGSLQNCTQRNGWCITPPNLALTANEPVSGYNILLIEGSLNGNRFACPNGATRCDVPLSEGDNNFSYWALSSWGDSSAMGSSLARVDTVGPNVGLDVGGASGTNGWYVSPATVTATGSDLTSGVASALLTADGVTWQASAVLNEGIHNIAVQVTDNAGNVSNATTALSVDTTTPSIDISVAGTMGSNGWYKSVIEVSAAASDATSGLAAHEVSVDGAAYQPYTAPVSLGDGRHTIQFKAVDRAGNLTETPVQEFNIDTLAPTVKLPHAWPLEKTVVYTVQEDGSGLAALRVVIEDEDERYAKVAWNETVSGSTFSDHIHWDGVFKDKTVAPPGTYLVWVKAADVAGNERFQLGQVNVRQPNVFVSLLPTEEPSLLVLPSPPAELFETEAVPPAAPASALGYGGAAAQPAETSTRSFSLAAGSAGGAAQSSTGVLWGAAAAAAIGAATAYALEAERKRKQEEAEQAARVASAIATHAKERAKKQQKQQENWNKQQALKQGQNKYPLHIDLKVARMEAEEGAAQLANAFKKFQESLRKTINQDKRTDRKDALAQEALSTYTAKPEDWKPAYDKYMAQKAFVEAQSKQKESGVPEQKTWWQKTWDGIKNTTEKAYQWVDEHQTEIAIGIGLLAGVAVVVLTAGMAVPFVLAAGSAALMAGGTVAAGTLLLNHHYGRPLGQNLLKNTSIAVGTALLTTSVGVFLTKGIFALGNSIAIFCRLNTAVCARADVVMNAFDKLEEVGLLAQGAFQSWRGDEDGARQTALELQMEYIDGGIPGNAVAKELGEDTIEGLAKYGDEAVDLFRLYGLDAAKVILAYGDEGIAIIQKYGDDGIFLLRKYGDDALRVINTYGDIAVRVMDTVDPAHAQKLLKTLDDDVIEDVMRQGPDAVEALSSWSEKALSGNGIELALRAKKDAEVLADVRRLVSLGPLDPKHLTKEQQELIDRIVENSMYYGKGGQLVLGKWVDYGSGFIEYAQDTSSVFYSPHPDVWNLLGKLENQADAAWALNKQAIQTGIAKGLPFEYTLNGIQPTKIADEKTAIEALFAGATDMEIMKILKSNYMPVRMKELQELQKFGYEFSFDQATNSYVLILP